MKATVIEPFTDLIDGGVCYPGETIERDDDRIADLVSKGVVVAIEETKKPRRK